MSDEEKVDGRINGPQDEPKERDGLIMRLVYMLIIWAMISLAQTILGAMTIIQYIILIINRGEPNEQLADFGTSLGIWIAKAARYQTAASNVKPWPWSELD
ncbi:MAG: DUF4389 domain-containing protein [Paracoccaceae bacterium]|jgi:hypothetical protein|nr:DUF4389 domain-containing protein [Paracoccaceae bacterium]MDP7185702.1 DUF4389 domain-containing protein [Paracoccaceae bacterium]